MAASCRMSCCRLLLLTALFCGFIASNIIGIFGQHHDHGHAHDHGHSHDEPSHFKYSRQANEEVDPHESLHEDHGHAHAHAHAHSHDHGHAHGGHGHAHHHGHAHDHGHAHGHSEDHTEEYKKWEDARPKPPKPKQSDWFMWLKALSATAFISVSPVFILLFIPLDNTAEHQSLLKILLSFASGGLLGDAFLHLIPHAVSPHSHGGDDHGHSHSHGHEHSHQHGGHNMSVGLWVLAGIIAFLVVEKFVRFIKGDGHGHSHSHAPPPVKSSDKKKAKSSDDEGENKDVAKDKTESKEKKEKKPSKESEKEKSSSDAKSGKKDDNSSTEVEPVADIKVAGYLNLAADFAHNFTDGLAIGASFLVSQNLGIITTITIFLHEIPHEIGDFAILVQSGCTKRRAMMLQFSTAIGAMLGTLSSLCAEGIGEVAMAWILPFTAGGFIYIATVSVIPELLEDCKLSQSLKEIGALLVGVYMMVLIGQFE